MTNPTRRTVVAAAAAATLAGCQTSATTPDGTKPIKKALREHYAGVDNVELIEIKGVAISDSEPGCHAEVIAEWADRLAREADER